MHVHSKSGSVFDHFQLEKPLRPKTQVALNVEQIVTFRIVRHSARNQLMLLSFGGFYVHMDHEPAYICRVFIKILVHSPEVLRILKRFGKELERG